MIFECSYITRRAGGQYRGTIFINSHRKSFKKRDLFLQSVTKPAKENNMYSARSVDAESFHAVHFVG